MNLWMEIIIWGVLVGGPITMLVFMTTQKFQQLKRWLINRRSPVANDPIKSITEISPHFCVMEKWADVGEEEHGVNPWRRRCKICGKIEYAYMGRGLPGDDFIWKEEQKPEDRLPLP